MTSIRKNPIFVPEGSAVLADIDERDVVIVTGFAKKYVNALGGYSDYPSGNSGNVVVPGKSEGSQGSQGSGLGNLIPQLGDISILSQTVNYSTTPPTVDVIFRVKNSTNSIIKGMKALVTS